MTAADRKAWMEGTPGGMLSRALGRDPFAVDHDAVDAEVEAVQRFYERTYDRRLTEAEVSQVRTGVELRSAPAQAVREMPRRTADIVALVNRTSPGAGWDCSQVEKPSEFARPPWVPGPRPLTTGISTTDPAVRERVEAAEEEKLRLAEEAYAAWRSGPLVMRTIAGPT